MSLISEDRTPLSISQLNQMVKELLESNLPPLWVEGEISNFARPASGHMYFSLKDEGCQVRTVMFRNRNMLLDFKPENGSHVLAKVRIGFYEARGEFQLIVDRMEEVGDGQLQQKFERLKQKLAAEGLFDEHIKQELPELPERVGIITSATGAAIRDVLSVLHRRFPAIPVAVYPVPVQGETAASEIAKTIQLVSDQQYCDVLLLVRGGGSLEDLWSFNEEIVARAIYDCEIPIVSGVGHETDITIADFAADVRAPTPSAAAELVTPDQYSYLQSFDYYAERLQQLMQQRIDQQGQKLGWLQKRLQQQHPQNQLAQYESRRQQLCRRLLMQWKNTQSEQRTALRLILLGLQQQHPAQHIRHQARELIAHVGQLKQRTQAQLEKKQQLLASHARTLNAYSPLQTLSRGYAIVNKIDSDQNILSVEQLAVDDKLKIRFHSGTAHSTITRIEPEKTSSNKTK